MKTFSAFCDELIARNLPIQWFGNARADNLTDPAFVHRLRRSGCWMLAMGIESESEEIRKDMVKRLERQKIQAAFDNMRDAGIRSFAFFIFGYPGETPRHDEPHDRLRDRARPRLRELLSGRAVPGHGALRQGASATACSSRKTGRGWSTWYYLLRGNGLDERVVMDAINRAKRRFFMRPAYSARTARRRAEARGDQAGDCRADSGARGVRGAGGQHPAGVRDARQPRHAGRRGLAT